MSFNIDDVHCQPLGTHHVRGAFCCAVPKIQNFCRFNARRDHDLYKVRVFVACAGDDPTVLGFYYLCLTVYQVGEVDETADAKFERVEAVPAVYLGMIGVHQALDRKGIGKRLMKDAFRRSLVIADNAGTYALALDALNEEVATYYQEQFAFERFAEGDLRMFLPISTIRQLDLT